MVSHDATLEFDYESASTARIVAESVAREVGEIDDERSRTTIDREAETVRLEIDAEDVVALRAALNTWFRSSTSPSGRPTPVPGRSKRVSDTGCCTDVPARPPSGGCAGNDVQ